MGKLQSIGVFDSGYGGLTILKELTSLLPSYAYKYLGDNARTPYGTRSFETVYQYTKQCVQWLFEQDCNLVILACNTASAKALRTIQQRDLPVLWPDKKVLGVIRPTAEIIGSFSKSGHIGILGTSGTVKSGSYLIEINKVAPGVKIFQKACPLWVPLVENNEFDNEGGEYFIRKDIEALLNESANIDTVLLGCTHYPLLEEKIRKFLPEGINIISQGKIVAASLEDYLKRHAEIEMNLSKNHTIEFYTTDSVEDFNRHAIDFYGEKVNSMHVDL